MKIAKPLQAVIESFQRLPGIGPKSAQRLAYYLLHVPQSQLDDFSEALRGLKEKTVLCSKCRDVAETDPCEICSSHERNVEQILVVEHPLDVIAFERTGKYKGLYHVLHGSINPLDNIGPDELYIMDLFKRVGDVKELIIATNPTMEGEATAMYITKQLKVKSEKLKVEDKNGEYKNSTLKITRLGMGVPTGAYLEFADENTLIQAFEGRRNL